MRTLLHLWADTEGQDMVEYTLLLFFIGTASVGLFLGLPDNMSVIWGKAQSQLNTATNAGSPGGAPGM
jgi:Flp pilus assembly pilin Flp